MAHGPCGKPCAERVSRWLGDNATSASCRTARYEFVKTGGDVVFAINGVRAKDTHILASRMEQPEIECKRCAALFVGHDSQARISGGVAVEDRARAVVRHAVNE